MFSNGFFLSSHFTFINVAYFRMFSVSSSMNFGDVELDQNYWIPMHTAKMFREEKNPPCTTGIVL